MTALRKPLAALGLVSVVWAIIWTLVLLRWRAGDHVPSGGELALYLLVLPTAVAILGGVAYAGLRRRRKGKSFPEGAQSTREVTGEAGKSAPTEIPGEAGWLALLDAQVLMPAGDTAEGLLQAARGAQRPTFYATVHDAQGRPVQVARVNAIAPDDIDWPPPIQTWSEARRRTLALVERLVLRAVQSNIDTLRRAAQTSRTGKVPAEALAIEWWLPRGWLHADALACRARLAERLSSCGCKPGELRVDVVETDGELAAWRRLDLLGRGDLRHPGAIPLLVVAGTSHVDQAQIRAWEEAHRLYSTAVPEGQVPGEGAACLLAVPATMADQLNAPVRLSRLFLKPRARPVDAPQRLQSDALVELARAVLSRYGCEAETSLTLFSDTDHRSSRCAEALHFAQALRPDEDPMRSLARLGVANGDCGMALGLSVIAAAMGYCAAHREPCLIFSNRDPALRAAMLLSPSPRPAPANAQWVSART